MADQKRPYRMKKRAEAEEATRRRITESAVAPPRHGRAPRARRSARWPSTPACAGRPSTATSPTRPRSSPPAPRTGRPRTRCPTSAPGPAIEDPGERLRAALDALYPYYRRTARMMENLIRDEPVSELVATALRRLPRLHRRRARGAAARPARAGPRAHARARRDRPRAGLHHVALARARRGPRRRPGGRAHGAPGGRLAMAASPPRLITIPISHFCEKARWALDRAGIAYREERHIQVIHRVASRRAGGGGTVPVLVAAEGVFAQSADILAYADRHRRARLYPEDPALRAEVRRARARLRRRPRAARRRRWVYFHILPRRDLGRDYNCPGVPAWERRAFPLLLGADVGLHPPPLRHRARDRRAGRRGGAADVRRGRRAAGGRAALPVRRRLHRRRPGLRRAGRRRRSSRPSTASRSPSPTSCRPPWRPACAPSAPIPAGAFAMRLFAEER